MKIASGDAPPAAGLGGGGVEHSGVGAPDSPLGAADHVLVPASQHTLVDATYHRDGSDLVLVDGQGARTVVDDFFAHQTLPDLRTPDGGAMPGELAGSLAGHDHPVQIADASGFDHQLAQATGAPKGQPIGTVDVLKGTVTATHVDGTKVVLAHGDPVFLRDVLESDKGGSIGVVFADKTTFALGEDGRMRLDELVYSPASKSGSLGLSVLKGAFVFVSGDIAATQSDAMTVRTPVGTIGIRGTAVGGHIHDNGVASTITLLEDPRGLVSAVQVTNAGGTQYLTHPNETVNIISFFTPPSAPYISTAAQNSLSFGLALGDLPALHIDTSTPIAPTTSGATSRNSAPQVGPQGSDTGTFHGAVHVTLDDTSLVNPLTGLAARLGIDVITLSNELAGLQAGPPHAVVFTIFTLGHDVFNHQNGFNNFDAFTIANSLQSGDIADGGFLGHNKLTALFDGVDKIDSTLSIKNVETIIFIIRGGANLTIDASGIHAALDGTTLFLTGSGTITINHAHDLTIDGTGFTGTEIINVDQGADITIIGGPLAVGGGGTGGTAIINASATTTGIILKGFAPGTGASGGNDSMIGGSGADTFVGLGGNDTMVGNGDNDVYLFGHGEMTAATVIQAGAAALVGGVLGHSEIRFESTTPGDTLVLSANITAPDGKFLITAAHDAAYANGTYTVPGSNMGDRTGTTPLGIDASAVSLSGGVTIMGNAGSDTLIGSSNSEPDSIVAGVGGSNVLVSGPGAVTMDGSQSGSNLFIIRAGADYNASDVIRGSNGADFIRFTSAAPGDTLTLNGNISDPNNTMTVSFSTDSANTSPTGTGSLTGTTPLALDAHLVALAGGLTIDGNNGNDQIVGTNASDTITVGNGNDTIGALVVGGVLTPNVTGGNDSITTGTGTDLIVYNVATLTANAVTIHASAAGTNELRLVGGGSLDMTGRPFSNLQTLGLSNGSYALTVDGSLGSFQHILSDASAGIAGATNNTITLTNYTLTAGSTVDLGAGSTSSTLNLWSVGGNNSVTVSNVQSINGGAGNDTITMATALNGAIDLLGGSNSLALANGTNSAFTATNVQTITGGVGADTDNITLTGATNVSLTDGSGTDTITDNGNGNDTITLGNGIDSVATGAGTDSLTIGTGADTIAFGTGNATIASSGNDVFLVSAGSHFTASDSINAGAHAETIRFTSLSANDVLTLNSHLVVGSLLVEASDAAGVLTGATALKIDATAAPLGITLLGNAGNDTLIGTAVHNDTITALGGNNSIVGGAGADSITAGNGADTINTGSGNATVSAGTGADTVLLGNGNDSIAVGSGADTIALGTGSDTVTAAGGNDIVLVGVGADYAATDVVTLGAGTDFVRFTSTTPSDALTLNANLTATGGHLTIEASDALGVLTGTTALKIDASLVPLSVTLLGNNGNDTLIGSSGHSDTITTGTGGNVITGSTVGNDSVTTGAGTDVILVGAGAFYVGDTIAGAGADTIRFTSTTASDALVMNSHVAAGSVTIEASDAAGVLTGTTALKIDASAVTQAITLLGNAGNDTLIGTAAQNDTITAGNGNNSIVGGSGADSITAGNGADTINTGSGAATVSAGTGADTVLLGNGNDSIALGNGADTLTLGTGSDTVVAGGGNDIVLVAVGADYAATDVVTLGHGADFVRFTSTTPSDALVLNSTLTATGGHLTIEASDALGGLTGTTALKIDASAVTQAITLLGNAGNDTLIGTSGVHNDTITAGNGNNSIVGGAGADSITAGTGNDTINTGSGAATVSAGTGADTVLLGNGNDSIALGNGADTIALGTGSDTVTAAGGNDIVLIAAGSGTTTDYAATDVVTLGHGADFVRFTSATANDALTLNANLTATAGSLTIEASDAAGGLTGATALKIDASAVTQAITLLGNAGNDTLIGTSGVHNDTITAGNGNNSIVGGAGADSITAGTGNDTINTGSGAATVSAGNGADTVLLGNGNDSIALGTGADTVTLGTGNDTVVAGGGNDVFVIGHGDFNTNDTLTGTGHDTIQFNGTTGDSLVLNGGSANLHVGGPFASLTIDGTGAAGNIAIDATALIQAVTIKGNAGNDTLTGTAGQNDTITALGGNNSIVGGAGADSITAGNGADTINTGSGAATVSAGNGADTVLLGNGNDSIAVGNGADTIALGTGSDTVTAAGGNDIVLVAAGSGTTTDYAATDTVTLGAGTDFVRFTSATANDALTLNANLTATAGSLTIEASDAAGGLTGATALKIDASAVTQAITLLGNAGNDTLIGTSGVHNDTITAGNGNNSIVGGSGADSITAGTGNDTINTGSGAATVSAGTGADTVLLGNGNDSIALGNGADTLTLGTGSDTVVAGGGNDVVLVAAGADYAATDVVTLGHGADFVRFTSATANDALTLNANLTATAGSLTIEASDALGGLTGTTALKIDASAVTQAITLLGNAGNDTLIGTSGVHNDTITAGNGNNSIVGGAGADSITAGTGNDTINTGSGGATVSAGTGADTVLLGNGNDSIALGNGADTIALGTGSDTVTAAGGNDIVLIAAGSGTTTDYAATDVVTLGHGADFVRFTSATANDALTLNANLTATAGSLTIEASDAAGGLTGATALKIDASAVTQAITLLGNAGNDTLIGTSGVHNDTITAGNGNNSIVGGAGADSITAGTGNDTINTGSGAATVSAGNGADTVLLGNGNDSIALGTGADTVTLGTGNDTVVAGGGNDVFVIGHGDFNTNDTLTGTGHDTIQFNGTTGDSLVLNGGSANLHVGGPFASLTIDGTGAAGNIAIDATALIQAVTIKGNAGNDTLTGTAGQNDTITALGGNNSIVGGAGADSITAGNGADTINTGSGAATVSAGNGADTVLLGNGNDSIAVGNGADTIALGTGSDTVTAAGGNDIVLVAAGSGTTTDYAATDTVTLGAGTDFVRFTSATANDALTLNANLTATAGSLTIEASDAAGGLTGATALKIDASAVTQAITLLGNAGNDTLIGTSGVHNDTITAGNGNNSIVGGSGADSITAGTGNDTINTGSGAATVSAGTGADTVLLGNGNDSIALGNGADTLTLGTGSDTVVAGGGNDVVLVAAGADYAATDVVTLGHGADFVRFTSATANDALTLNANLTATAGSLTIEASDALGGLTGTTALKIDASAVTQAITLLGNAGNDTLIGTSGVHNDTITAGNGNNSIVGGAGADSITAGTGNDTINTGSGGATVSAGTGADTVLLGNGNDSIALGNGADTIALGTGSDTVTAAGGNDIVLIAAGSGTTTDYAATDVVTLGHGADFVRFTSATANDALTLNANLTATAGSLTIEASDAAGGLTGATALKIDASAVTQAITLLGNAGNDTLIGTSGVHNDTITAGNGNNSIVGGAGADSITAGTGNDTINTGSGAATVSAGNGADTVLLGNGNDSIALGTGADTVTLGTGNDTVVAGGGNDVVQIAAGSGTTTDYAATDTVTLGHGADFVRFTSVTANDALILNANLTATAGSLTIEASDALGGLTGTTALKIDASAVTQAITLLGNAGNDTLIGTAFADTITAGGGANSVVGGNGNDSVTVGNGADTVTVGNGTDTLVFGNGNDSITLGTGADTLTFGTGNDTVVTTGNDVFLVGAPGNFAASDSINAGGHTEIIRFTDTTAGDTLTLNNLITAGSLTVEASDALGGLTGTTALKIDASAVTQAITLLGNAGNDTLIGTAGVHNDTITALGGNNSIQGGAGADSITAAGGNDTINTGIGAATVSAGTGADTVLLGNGNDSIALGTGADTVTLGTGTDTVVAGGGNDVVLIAAGSGTTTDYAATDTVTLGHGADFVRFTSVTANDALILNANLTATAGSLTIEASDALGGLTGTTALKIDASAVTQAITLLGNAGNDTLIGTAFADTITAGGGANSVVGGNGNDSVTVGNGADTVTVGNGTDTLVFGNGNDSITLGTGADTLTFGTGNDTVVTTGNDVFLVGAPGNFAASDSINAGGHTEIIRFTDTTAGDTLTLNNLITAGSLTVEASDAAGVTSGGTALAINGSSLGSGATLIGNAGADTLIGGAGGDSIVAGAGANSIQGGTGADTILAGGGTNTIVLGNGNDSVTVGTGNDTLSLGTGIDTVTAANGNDVVLIGHGDYAVGDTIGLTTGADFVRFTSVTANDVLTLNANLTATGGSLTIEASDAAGVLTGATALQIDAHLVTQAVTLLGNAGNDTLIGTAFADTITALDGANSISSGAGNDSITVGIGNDAIVAGNGNDNIVLGNGALDTVTLGTGADTLSLGTGDDRITTSGNDVFLISDGTHFNSFDLINGGAGVAVTLRFTDTTAGTLTVFNQITAPGGLTIEASDATGALTGTTALKIDATNVGQTMTLLGNAGADTLIGASGFADTITAGAGANSIVGGTSDDSITAGTGANTIIGGSGADTITAGTNTTFLYQAFTDSHETAPGDGHVDLLSQLAPGNTIDLNGLAVTLTGPANLGPAATLAAGEALIVGAQAAGHVNYFTVGTDTYVDVSHGGTGYSVADLLIHITGTPSVIISVSQHTLHG